MSLIEERKRELPIEEFRNVTWKEWLTALRSGMYEQGQSVLRNTAGSERGSFCCQGVYCDLVRPEWHTRNSSRGASIWFSPNDSLPHPYLPNNVQSEVSMPQEVAQAINEKLGSHFTGTLIALNDSHAYRYSFPRIADFIEASLLLNGVDQCEVIYDWTGNA